MTQDDADARIARLEERLDEVLEEATSTREQLAALADRVGRLECPDAVDSG